MAIPSGGVVGRLAPSPTGAQHVGNARTFLAAWLSVRSRGGRLILRIEDIDSPRVKRGADQQAIDDLAWLGLDWDEGPDRPGSVGPYYQTQRLAAYSEILDALRDAERIYPCTCSRSDVADAASAPHAGHEPPVYPGTCASRDARDAHSLEGRAYCWRFRVARGPSTFVDDLAGPVACDAARELGDFVIARSDERPAYQLAVVVDDRAMGVNEVVRGDDLVPSTFRQRGILDCLGWPAPRYAHVPLVVGPDGRRLAKRHGDTRLATFRNLGVSSDRLVGLLAWSCGWLDRPEPIAPRDLIPRFRWSSVPRTAWCFDESARRWLGGGTVRTP
ncbi:MAG: tRNA glutamyl-Q(34) synthetase GluQRS [Planctomycetes bacterium]|nr:tRNA glutamyl-Q(34) synthetase GluQRS [Planctomycetota bacterium]